MWMSHPDSSSYIYQLWCAGYQRPGPEVDLGAGWFLGNEPDRIQVQPATCGRWMSVGAAWGNLPWVRGSDPPYLVESFGLGPGLGLVCLMVPCRQAALYGFRCMGPLYASVLRHLGSKFGAVGWTRERAPGLGRGLEGGYWGVRGWATCLGWRDAGWSRCKSNPEGLTALPSLGSAAFVRGVPLSRVGAALCHCYVSVYSAVFAYSSCM